MSPPSQIAFQRGSPQPVVLAGNGTVNVGFNEACWQPLPGIENGDSDKRYASTWLSLETSKMTSENLKKRAKNLRHAIEWMLRVPVSHSQALELVAKEENYPNWDAACASFSGSSGRSSSLRHANDPSNVGIRKMLAPSSNLGALIVVWGVTGQGKTPTARAIVEDLIGQANAACPTAILHAAGRDFTYPETATVRYVPEAESILRSGQLTEQLIVVDELRDPHTTFEVVALVLAGAKVIVTIHAKSPIDRLRALLNAQGAGEQFLDRLVDNGQVLAITARN